MSISGDSHVINLCMWQKCRNKKIEDEEKKLTTTKMQVIASTPVQMGSIVIIRLIRSPLKDLDCDEIKIALTLRISAKLC